MTTSEVSEAIVHELSNELQKGLTGRDLGDLLHRAKPQRHYPVGCIFPEPDQGESSLRPASCGLTVRMAAERGAIVRATVKGHYYVRRRPNLEEQRQHLVRHWGLRMDRLSQKLDSSPTVTLPYSWLYIPFEIKVDIANGVADERDCTESLVEAWKRHSAGTTSSPYNDVRARMGMVEAPGKDWKDEEDYQEWLDENFPQSLPSPDSNRTHALTLDYWWKDGTLKVFAINQSGRPKDSGGEWFLLDQSIFIDNIELAVPKAVVVKPIESVLVDTFEAKATATSWGEGRNLQVRREGSRLIAEPFGILKTPRLRPREKIPDVELSFEALSGDPLPASEAVISYLERFVSSYAELHHNIGTSQSKNALAEISSVVERARKGLELLRSDSAMLEAFRLMNETFRRRYLCEPGISSWRVFQFVYILGKVPHIIEGEEDIFDVIFVNTGGGKTEAYFGLLVTALFYLRLTGVNFGTVAVVKFPLRMLALDQIQRIAPLIAVADLVRKEHNELGAESEDPNWLREFSLGFMIGGTSSRTTPNRVHGYRPPESREEVSDEEAEIPTQVTDLYEVLQNYPQEVKLFYECPVCRYRSHLAGHDCDSTYDSVEISYDPSEIRAKHQCTECKTRFALHWSDEECFRYLPSIIISTQDRVAYGAFAPHFRALLGAPLYVCPLHGFSIYSDACTPFSDNGGYGRHSGTCQHLMQRRELEEEISRPRDRAIRFVIQDEMHLLRSDLGSIDSPFEKMVADVVHRYCDRRPQYIGMSATVQGVQRQVQEIYGSDKDVWLFPGDPPCKDFSKEPPEDAFLERSSELSKLFVGCMPSGEDPSTVVYRAMEIATAAVSEWETSNEGKRASLPNRLQEIPRDSLADVLRQYRVNLGFMRTKIDLERTKQNLENITNVERRKLARVSDATLRELSVEELTGDNSIKDIRDAINRIRDTSRLEPQTRLDILLATNLVSHGIDLREMNLMTFYGVPGSTAEYLQAFSRVGRILSGLVFVVYHPRRARDRGLWRTFNQYHQALRQQVEMIPVDHLAPGLLDQTLVTLVRNYWNLLAEPLISHGKQAIYKLHQIVSASQVPPTREILVDLAAECIVSWYGWSDSRAGPIAQRIEDYVEALKRYHDRAKRKGYPRSLDIHRPPPYSYSQLYDLISTFAGEWMSTMTGIRGIQPGFTHGGTRFTSVYLGSRGVE